MAAKKRIMRLPGKPTVRPTIPPSKSPPPRGTITLRDMAATIAAEHEIPKRTAEGIIGDTFGLIAKNLKTGNRIRLAGLGVLMIRNRAARIGRNPTTGESINIKASKRVAFRAAKGLKESI